MPIEREFKYLLMNTPVVEFAVRKQASSVRLIEQGYFDKGGRIRRLRKLNKKGGLAGTPKHVFTYKHDLNDRSGIMEIETDISPADYNRLWPDTDHRLVKKRYEVPHEEHVWEVDFFLYPEGPKGKDESPCYLVMAECEVDPGCGTRPTPPPVVANFLLYSVDEFDKRFTNRKLSDPNNVTKTLKELGLT